MDADYTTEPKPLSKEHIERIRGEQTEGESTDWWSNVRDLLDHITVVEAERESLRKLSQEVLQRERDWFKERDGIIETVAFAWKEADEAIGPDTVESTGLRRCRELVEKYRTKAPQAVPG